MANEPTVTVETPVVAEPKTARGFLESFLSDDVEMKVDSEGQIVFDTGTAEPSGVPDPSVAPVAPVVTPAVEPIVTPAVDWEKRYKDLQSDYTTKAQELSEVKSTVANLTGKVEALLSGKERTPEDSDSPSFQEETEEAKITRLVTKTLETVLGTGAIKSINAQSALQREFDAVQVKYTDFKEFAPAMKQVMEKLPDLHLNFEQAYLLTKKLASEVTTAAPGTVEAPKTTTTQTPATPSTAQVDALKAKAASLRTEQGVASVTEAKKPVRSIRDCVAASWEEVGAAS